MELTVVQTLKKFIMEATNTRSIKDHLWAHF
jgi:hypothetical protein